ncbi:hypothetical protein [Planctomicrobium piriforme]|uniref:hypothetical protein n=1 Tax=Planctomicrobium piriforme TaxID=1576369 RepID=UPI0015875DE6|nr:hypothetical protein [Planctomicrobium piriforme]
MQLMVSIGAKYGFEAIMFEFDFAPDKCLIWAVPSVKTKNPTWEEKRARRERMWRDE